MNLIRDMVRTCALMAIAFTMALPSHIQAQTKTPPTIIQVPGGIMQTPWFSNPQIRQELKFNDTQFNNLNQAYQNAWTTYQKGLMNIDPKLPDAQRQQQIQQLQQNFYQNFSSAPNKILTDPTQRQRFDQLAWQYRGYGAFNDPAVTNKLNLTQQQRDKLNQLQQTWTTQMSKLEPAFQTNRDQAMQQFTKIQAQTAGQLNSILTPEQQATWRQMTGNPYTFTPDVYFRTSSSSGGKQ